MTQISGTKTAYGQAISNIRFCSSKFLAGFKGFVRRHGLFSPGDAIVIALSGGRDSVCLFHLLKCLSIPWRLRLYAAHFEHGIRGTESLEDAAFSKMLAEEWETEFFTDSGDIPVFARKNGLSCQEAARVKRYDFLHKVLAETRADFIATAHTATDQAEEFLIRMIRGSGLSGLGGIPARRGNIVRPLLWAERNSITSYLARRNIPFRDDSSNQDTHYLRNRVRHELVPFLQENFNPAITGTLNRITDILRQDADMLEELAEEAFQDTCGMAESTCMDRTKAGKLKEAVRRRVIIRFLTENGIHAGRITSYHITATSHLITGTGRHGQVDLPDGRILTLYDDIIEVSDAEASIHSAVKLAEPCHHKTVTIDNEGEYMLPCGGRITALSSVLQNISPKIIPFQRLYGWMWNRLHFLWNCDTEDLETDLCP